jgi:hypothetical protein
LTVPQEPAGPRVATVLESLVLQKLSGVLRVAGDPSGAFYLDHGQLTYGEAPWSPDLAARLRALPKPSRRLTEFLAEAGPPGRDLGESLLAGQYLPKASLRAVLKSMLVDALIVLTMPLPDETSVAGTRFEAMERHWTSACPAHRLDTLSAVAAKKAGVLATAKTGLTSPLELRDLSQPWTVIKREHWDVASRIKGSTSIRDIAVESGVPLHDTIERVGFLIKKEMCAPVTVPGYAKTGPSAPESWRARPGAPIAGNGPSASDNDDDDAAGSAPSAEQLRRVLEGLRRLS